MSKRCFGEGKPFYEKYHDHEWGVPVHDEIQLFEMLVLEGAQAGLSWETILKKREGYRAAFLGFDPKKVAYMTEFQLEALLTNPKIVRNKLKIFSVKKNALVFLTIQKEFGSFNHYLWSFVNHQPLINHFHTTQQIPVSTELSDAISTDLKNRGMSFVGSTIIYAYLQAVGIVNDHLIDCPAKYSSSFNIRSLSC